MRTKLLVSIGAIGILLATVLLFRLGRQVADQRNEKMKRPVNTAAPTDSSAAAPGASSAAPAAAQVSAPEASGPATSDASFPDWLKDEAKNVDHLNINNQAVDAQVAKEIAHLTPVKSHHLLQTVLNVSSTAGEKILSAYMLVQGGVASRAELVQLIATPISVKGPIVPHSESEMRSVQDRAMRVMAVDGLITQAKNDPSARETLAQTIRDIPDPYIRQYAQKRLDEMSGSGGH